MTRRSRGILLAPFLIASGLRVAAVLVSAPVDDAFITYRYARNIAAGHGFVYNVGERVLGTTTPFFTLLLTPFAGLGFPLEKAAVALAVLASLGTMGLLFSFVRRATRGAVAGRDDVAESAGLLAASLYALFYAQIASCGYGMETQVFEFLGLAALAAAAAGRTRVAALAAGLAALTRPEGFLLAMLLGIAALVRRMRKRGPLPWGAVAVFAAIVLPWIAFATLYFGSFIPNSALAKASQRSISAGDWGRFFVWRNPVIALAWTVSAVGAAWAWTRRSGSLGLLAAWAMAYVLFFLVARPPFLGNWYFPPLAGPLMGLVAAGVLPAALRCRPIRSDPALVVLPAALRDHFPRPGLALAAFAAVWAALLAISVPRALQSAAWSKQIAERVYLPMAVWTRDHTAPNEVVEMSDIGYVGYLSGRTILDAGGLVSPELWRDYTTHAGDPKKDVHFTLDRKPAVLLLPTGRGTYQRFVEGGLLDVYEPMARFRAEGSTDLPRSGALLPPEQRTGRLVPDFIALRRIEGR
jgi:hypothetical protein